jgi:hypothetical protein
MTAFEKAAAAVPSTRRKRLGDGMLTPVEVQERGAVRQIRQPRPVDESGPDCGSVPELPLWTKSAVCRRQKNMRFVRGEPPAVC